MQRYQYSKEPEDNDFIGYFQKHLDFTKFLSIFQAWNNL